MAPLACTHCVTCAPDGACAHCVTCAPLGALCQLWHGSVEATLGTVDMFEQVCRHGTDMCIDMCMGLEEPHSAPADWVRLAAVSSPIGAAAKQKTSHC